MRSHSKSDRPTVKAQCLRLLVTLKLDPAKMQLISGFVDSYLNLDSTEEQIMEITTSWEQKGRLDEKLSIALRLLNRKLDNLPEAIAIQVKSLESSQLDTLTEDLLDFQTLDDLQTWLSNL